MAPWYGYDILRPVAMHPQATYLLLHAYWERGKPMGQDGHWHAWRPMRPPGFGGVNDPGGPMWIFRDKPVIISEFNRPWVRGDANDERAVAEEVVTFYKTYATNPRVKGCIFYQWSGPDGMSTPTFNVDCNQPLQDAIRALALETPTPQPPLPPTPTEPVVKLGFKRFYDCPGMVAVMGKPLRNEDVLWAQDEQTQVGAYQLMEWGTLWWFKMANDMEFRTHDKKMLWLYKEGRPPRSVKL